MPITEQEWDVAHKKLTNQLWLGAPYSVSYGMDMIEGTPSRPYRNGNEAFDLATQILAESRLKQEGVADRPGVKPFWIYLVEAVEVASMTSMGVSALASIGLPLALAKNAVDQLKRMNGLPSTTESVIESAATLLLQNPAKAFAILSSVWKKLFVNRAGGNPA